jgi:hypothetical protein
MHQGNLVMSRLLNAPAGRRAARSFPLLAISLLAVGCLTTTVPPVTAAAEAAPVAVGPYDAAVAYPAGSLAVGPDGNTYRAAKAVKGIDPTQAKADSWQLAYAAKEVILDVPTRFKSIAEAMAFLGGCRIAETAKAVVLVAPGKLEHDAPLVLNHAEGARIVIRGAGEKPEECVLEFDGSNGIEVNGGGEIHVETVSLVSKADDKATGLFLEHGSAAQIRNCEIIDFAYAVFVNDGSRLRASGCVFISKGTQDSVNVRSSSNAILIDCEAKAMLKEGGHNGFAAFNGGAIECFGCRAENWYSGFSATTSASMYLERCVGRSNNHGASAWAGSSLMAVDSTFASNKQSGIFAISSAAEVFGCTLTANNSGVAANGAATVNFAGKPTRISDSEIGFFSHFGGRARVMVLPVYRNVEREIAVGVEPGNLTKEEAVLRVE